VAVIYCDSNASGGDDGTDWTNAYEDLPAALTAWNPGDVIWLAHNSAETSGSGKTLGATNATRAVHCPVYRVNSGTDVYDNSDATVNYAVTGGAADITITTFIAFHGVRFSGGDNIIPGNGADSVKFIDCHLTLTGASSILQHGSASADNFAYYNNCVINFSSGSGGWILNTNNSITFDNCEFQGNAITNGLLRITSARHSTYAFNACDFSALTNDTLVDISPANDTQLRVDFNACSLPSGVSITDGGFQGEGQIVVVSGCDQPGSGNAKRYRNEVHTFRGVTSYNITSYHNNGLVDEDGSTRLSYEMNPNSNTTIQTPLEGIPLYVYVDSIGSTIFTVEVVENFTSALTDTEAWMDIYVYDTADDAKWEKYSTRNTDISSAGSSLAAGTGLANWTGEPGSSRSAKFEKTITINEVGYVKAIVYLGIEEAGQVLHYDDSITVS
jgi:hypothetical protein